MAITQAKKKGTQTPPINADPPVLGPTQYPGPRGRPVRTRPFDANAWVQANQRPTRGGGQPAPQGPEQEPTLDRGGRIGYGDNDQMKQPPGGWARQVPPMEAPVKKPGYAGSLSDMVGRNPYENDWDPSKWGGRPGQSGPYGGINPGGRPRLPDGRIDYGSSTDGDNSKWIASQNNNDMKGIPGQGGEQVPGGFRNPNGTPKPQMQMTDYERQAGQSPAPGMPPVGQGGPVGGGRPGRQPLRPGMEYRPGGGQRPVRGGMTGAPQDGGMSQIQGNYDSWVGQGGVDPRFPNGGGAPMDPAQHAQWSNGQLPQGPAGGGQDPQQMNEWRRRLMEMQQQGPMNNQYYGAF